MEKQIRYKVLRDLESPFQKHQYTFGEEYHCSDFDTDETKDCSQGFYATKPEGLVYCLNAQRNSAVYECEVWGKSVEMNCYKMRYENIKIIRKLTKQQVIKLIKAEHYDYDVAKILYPVNPLRGRAKQVTKIEIDLLKKWDSTDNLVRDSVRGSVWGLVKDSIGDLDEDAVWGSVSGSVWRSVGNSLWGSGWGSVWSLVWAYIGSCFPNIRTWQDIEHKEGEYPFQPAVDLLERGFVPVLTRATWRLHSGKKAKVVFEIKKEDL